MSGIVYPDYSNSILNIASSVMSHFGAEAAYPTLPCLDRVLEDRYKNVVLMVFDAGQPLREVLLW